MSDFTDLYDPAMPEAHKVDLYAYFARVREEDLAPEPEPEPDAPC